MRRRAPPNRNTEGLSAESRCVDDAPGLTQTVRATGPDPSRVPWALEAMPYAAIAALGVVGLGSAVSQAPLSLAGILVGVAFLGIALARVLGLRVLAWLGALALLSALSCWHVVLLLRQGSTPCGCLRALGQPTHGVLLLILAPLLLCVAALGRPAELRARTSAAPLLVLLGGLLGGVLLAVSTSSGAGEFGTEAGPAIASHGPVIPGAQPVLHAPAMRREDGEPSRAAPAPGAERSWILDVAFPAEHGGATGDLVLMSETNEALHVVSNMTVPESLRLRLKRAQCGDVPASHTVVLQIQGVMSAEAPIDWDAEGPAGVVGRARFEMVSGRPLRGRFLDLVGQPVPGLTGVAYYEVGPDRFWTAEQRARSLTRAGRRSATFVTGADGRFQVVGVPEGAAVGVSSMSPDWFVLAWPIELQSAGISAETAAAIQRVLRGQSGDEAEFRVARVLLCGCEVHVAPEGSEEGRPIAGLEVTDKQEPRSSEDLIRSPTTWVTRVNMVPQNHVRFSTWWTTPQGAARLERQEAGTARVWAPGMQEQTARLFWWSPSASCPDITVLQPVTRWPRENLILRFTEDMAALLPPGSFFSVRLQRVEDMRSATISVRVEAEGRLVSLAPLPRGPYRIESRWFVSPVIAEVGRECAVEARHLACVAVHGTLLDGLEWRDLTWGVFDVDLHPNGAGTLRDGFHTLKLSRPLADTCTWKVREDGISWWFDIQRGTTLRLAVGLVCERLGVARQIRQVELHAGKKAVLNLGAIRRESRR